MAAFQSELWTKLLRCEGNIRDGVWGRDKDITRLCSSHSKTTTQKAAHIPIRAGDHPSASAAHGAGAVACHINPEPGASPPGRRGSAMEKRGRGLRPGRVVIVTLVSAVCSEDKNNLQAPKDKRSVTAKRRKCFVPSSTYFPLSCHTHLWNATRRVGRWCNILAGLEVLSMHPNIVHFSCRRQGPYNISYKRTVNLRTPTF